MKVIQLVPSLYYGDAVGNDVLALDDAMKRAGIETKIYAQYIEPRCKGRAEDWTRFRGASRDDVVIYHMASGAGMADGFAKLSCKRLLFYHNVTPKAFFEPYSLETVKAVQLGLDQVKYLAAHTDYCLADSEFNRQDLLAMGYNCPIEVLPILIPFADYEKEPNQEVVRRMSDGRTNIVFAGRVAPNKCHEDILAAFDAYKRLCDAQARLILVGNYDRKDPYYQRLVDYVQALGVEDVLFTGHIAFDEILAYYRTADCFVCMSEHEGFCVPLVEAMFFDVPIVAYNSTAIPYTLGGAGLLVDEKDPVLVAKLIQRVVQDAHLREAVLQSQRIRLQAFAHDRIEAQFLSCLQRLMEANA